MTTTRFKVNDRVRFTKTIDRYPFTVVDVGDTGTVAEIEESYVYIQMDNAQTARDLEEWNGQLMLSNTPITDLSLHAYEGLDSITERNP